MHECSPNIENWFLASFAFNFSHINSPPKAAHIVESYTLSPTIDNKAANTTSSRYLLLETSSLLDMKLISFWHWNYFHPFYDFTLNELNKLKDSFPL